MNISNSRITGT